MKKKLIVVVLVFLFSSCLSAVQNGNETHTSVEEILIEEESHERKEESEGHEEEEELGGEPLGVQDGWIPDRAIIASSEWDSNHGARLARLYNQRRGKLAGGWSAKKNDAKQWLQIDFGGDTAVTDVITQGRQDADQWVTEFTVGVSEDGKKFRIIRSKGHPIYFHGNSDRNSLVHHEIDPPVQAHYIRVYPSKWHNHISMRIEIKGADQRKLTKCPVSIDLGFVIDGSKAVHASSFLQEKKFAKQVASTLPISRHKSHIGFVTYSDKAHVYLDFSDVSSFAEVDSKIGKAAYPNGVHERLDLGLGEAYKTLIKNQAQGFIPEQSIVAITTHQAINKRTWYIIKKKQALERKGINVFLVVIGRRRTGLRKKLKLKSGDSIFFLPSFESLAIYTARISHAICHHQHKETDIHKFFKATKY